MAELKTKLNDGSVDDFINTIDDLQKREDSIKIIKLMKEITGETPKMWGSSIVGFGQYHYKYHSGREGDWMKTGFSPRKQNLTIYAMCNVNKYSQLLSKLGKHKTGKGCLYIKKLDDIDRDILKELVTETFVYMSKKYD